MVNEKQTKRERNIKSKLMAAIAMLLVSSIMMVSTTYAWFTLSTAPEVTGITTAVGANGNLEMALLPTDGSVNSITSGTGDSLLGTVAKNVTWGNLVDLSDSSYGLSKISLYPSKLNATNGKLADTYLSTPKYGSDGRLMSDFGNAMAAAYGTGAFDQESEYGVRAVGVASGMSGREQAYRNALAAGNAAASKAHEAASKSMATGGTALASVGMKKAQGGNSFTKDDLSQIRTALYAMIDPNTGALTYAEQSMIQYLLAYGVAKADEANYATVLSNFDSVTSLSDSTAATMASTASVTAQATAITSLISKVTAAVEELDTKINDTTVTSYKWDDISKYVLMLGDTDTMTLCGQKLNYWLEKDNDSGEYLHINELMSNVSNLILVLQPSTTNGNGVYIEMADIVGYFESEVTFNNLTFGSWNLSGLKATMQVNPSVNPTHLVKGKQVASTNVSFGEGGTAISDFYGYIIDMAFRTNAVDSDLMLQTDSIDRIYADSDVNENTMGGGSTMSFSLQGVENFNVTQLANLMSYIRIIFFDPSTKTIYGEARLDFNQVTNQDGRALELGADGKYEQTWEVTTKDDEGNDVTTTESGYLWVNPATNKKEKVEVTSISMAMKMWDDQANPIYQEDDAGNRVQVDGKYVITGYNGGWAANAKIMDLVQNTATAVSALVYMDGEKITNADASTENITGTMNIQFSSSATLTPMEYGELRQPADKETIPSTPAVSDVTTTITENYTVTTAKYVDGVGIVAVITDGTNAITDTGYTVTIGGENATYRTVTGYGSAWVVAASSAPTGEVAIVVTAATQSGT